MCLVCVHREEAQFLREQQDREYQESLEADRLRVSVCVLACLCLQSGWE
jgi:hypothetical protein